MPTADSPPRSAAARFLIIPELDRMPRVVRFVQTVPGKIVLVSAFTALHHLFGSPLGSGLFVALLLLSLFPSHRLPLVVASTFLIQWMYDPVGWGSPTEILRTVKVVSRIVWPEWMSHAPLFLVLVLLFSGTYLKLLERFRSSGPMRAPFAMWMALYVLLLTVASYVPMLETRAVALWAGLVVLSKYFWFVGYSILDVAHSGKFSPMSQIGFWRPFWGSTYIPYPRGAMYLRKIESKTPEELAVTQLKGLKLLMWAGVLALVLHALLMFVHGDPANLPWWLPGTLGAPRFDATLRAHLAGNPFPASLCWVSVIMLFTGNMINLAVFGHIIIAICRMAGYRALRNSYRPLEATSFADFYNRYYFYFKEMMVHFFFFPTYMRFFRKSPRLRVFFATLAAAGFGNAFYHFTRDLDKIMIWGIGEALVRYHVALIYFFVLGVVISLSQMRDIRAPDHQPRKRTLLTTVTILSFYGMTNVIADPDPTLTARDYGSYILALFLPGFR